MFHLIYTSIANRGVSEVELKDLLTKARINNSTIGITGLLIYKDRRFMQLIEGDEKAVQELMDKIKADDRHRGILILQAGHSKEREFTDWAMAFRSPASQLANDLSDPAELAFTEEALARHSSNAAKLLRLFEKHFLRHTYNPRHSQYAKRGESPTSANECWLPRMDSNHE